MLWSDVRRSVLILSSTHVPGTIDAMGTLYLCSVNHRYDTNINIICLCSPACHLPGFLSPVMSDRSRSHRIASCLAFIPSCLSSICIFPCGYVRTLGGLNFTISISHVGRLRKDWFQSMLISVGQGVRCFWESCEKTQGQEYHAKKFCSCSHISI